MKCKHLKIRKQKGTIYYYCSLKRKVVDSSCYKNCSDKEYKIYKKLSTYSSKRRKREKERFSVFYSNLDKCCVCESTYQMTKHEIFEGSGKRSNLMKYGFVLPLCLKCHRELQEDSLFNQTWKIKAQTYFEKNYGSREEFIKLFGRNFL